MEDEKYKSFVIEDTEYKTIITKKFENRIPWQKPNPENIFSYIPGTIIEIFVKEGDTVKLGQPILLLEAMKMLNQVTSPKDGTIKQLTVTVGDKIPKGRLMFEIID